MRIAIVGPGNVGHLHARAARTLPGVTLAAVWGRNRAKAEAFAAHYGPAVRPYDDLDRMVRQEKIDLVIVTTTHKTHLGPTVAALEAGANVLIEKPMAVSLADCDEMLTTAQRHNRMLSVVSQRRFYEPCRRMRRAIDAGHIGQPALGTVQLYGWRDEAYYGSGTWRGTWADEGGGVLVNQAPHQLDLLLWYMGPVLDVYGRWANLNHPYIEVEDTALAIVRFRNGGLGNIVVSNSQRPGLFGKVHIHGSNGASVGAQTEGGAMFIAGKTSIAEPPVNDLWTVPGQETHLADWQREDTEFFGQTDATLYYFARQIADCCEAIQTHRPPLVTGEDGRRVVELFSAIYESTRSGTAVSL
jgi:UDP-N-acetyl-2-amino-2-deoxyglucuronate dehydrogenase